MDILSNATIYCIVCVLYSLYRLEIQKYSLLPRNVLLLQNQKKLSSKLRYICLTFHIFSCNSNETIEHTRSRIALLLKIQFVVQKRCDPMHFHHLFLQVAGRQQQPVFRKLFATGPDREWTKSAAYGMIFWAETSEQYKSSPAAIFGASLNDKFCITRRLLTTVVVQYSEKLVKSWE